MALRYKVVGFVPVPNQFCVLFGFGLFLQLAFRFLSFFKWTIKSEIAAGVTPGSLEALARLWGRASESFCFTSFERPITFS